MKSPINSIDLLLLLFAVTLISTGLGVVIWIILAARFIRGVRRAVRAYEVRWPHIDVRYEDIPLNYNFRPYLYS